MTTAVASLPKDDLVQAMTGDAALMRAEQHVSGSHAGAPTVLEVSGLSHGDTYHDDLVRRACR